MNQLIDFCASEIDSIEKLLHPYYEKYECNSSFKLVNLNTVTPSDVKEILELVYKKDAYVSLINKILASYQAPIQPEDLDVEAKRRCIFSVADVLLELVSNPKIITLDKLNSIPSSTVLDHTAQCIMAKDLELATFGLVYLLYQKHFEKTNKADARIEKPYQEPEPLVTT